VNLERLYIENYKQFREPLELHPPEGAVGVVGSNGAGKSTLFESILWAFFGARGGGPRFANESIPWSGGSTKDPTVVEATLTDGNASYTVRRQLKGTATTAEARDSDGRVIVTGAADVARWAEENLLHMDRTAFEATFYARQKELRFFANDEGISRVRRISRLLGISGVETAQQLLRGDRNELRAEARVIEGSLAEADLDGLQRELEEAQAECSRLEGELERLDAELEAANEERSAAREERGALEAAYREHTRLAGELRDAEGEGRRAAERVQEAERELAVLREAEEELERLRPQTARLPEVAQRLEGLEDDRRRAQQRESDRRELLRGKSRLNAIEGEVYDLADELAGEDEEPVPGLLDLQDLEGEELLREMVEVLDRAGNELARAEGRYEELRALQKVHEDYAAADGDARAAREKFEEARDAAEKIAEELADYSAGEDLEREERDLQAEEERLRSLVAHHRARRVNGESEADNVDRAREAIADGTEKHCPTCQRGFEHGEHGEILQTLKRQAASLRRQAAREAEGEEKFSRLVEDTVERRKKLSGRIGRFRELRDALVRARDRASDRESDLNEREERLAAMKADLTGSAAPTEEDLEAARLRTERLRALRDARPAVTSLAREHGALTERLHKLTVALDAVADLRYDEDEHTSVGQEKQRLDRLIGRVEALEGRLDTRPGVEQTLAEARQRVEQERTRAAQLRIGLEDLAFDEESYEKAATRLAEADDRVGALRDRREALGGDWKDADHAIGRAKGELKRLEADRKRAGEKAAAAARMDEMDALFTEFFRSLTARVRPMLEGEASTLIRELTDGRYERMEFDDNYRVRLLDRFDDAYAIERFSGGEADVASLSARVALSRLIAARGGGALGFLVLDEVFGSLDAERRTNVLLALERLKRTFGQIFIISHVGDVQESALLDELWTVVEDEDGKSTVVRSGAAATAEFAFTSDA
jgi:DNA repair protein SbcC/Rad50